MLTINGIYTDIYESTYNCKVDNMKFYLEEQKKLELKYNANIKCKPLMLIKLYTMIEKRGFRIEIDDKTIDNVPLFKIEYVI